MLAQMLGMRAASGKYHVLVMKKATCGWLVGHLVSGQEVNNCGSVLSEGRPALLLQFGWVGGTTGTLRAMWGECESACCHGNKAAPQSPVPIKKDGWQRSCGSVGV